MRIEHIAIWTPDLDRLRHFYTTYFGASAGPRYHNPRKNFSSYFLTFASGARLEIMHRPDVTPTPNQNQTYYGYAHFALVVGDETAVDTLAHSLHQAGIPHLDGPRRTGDGYYEALFLDPDGNKIEIMAHRNYDP
ncbi:MAG TPA: VOC family protein [Anaerolineae bacterium]|nr:VOC family protein [Anaerolineae bacterium]